MTENEVSKVIGNIKENVLKKALNGGFVIFFYTKSDGTKRKAIGTRNVSTVQAISSWRPTGAKENASSLCYFDLEKLAWRSMRFGSLIDIAVADFSKSWIDPERYVVSQAFAARDAINEAIANGEAGNVPHLVDILANNTVWQPQDEFVIKGNYDSLKQQAAESRIEYSKLKEEYNKLVDEYNTLAERHNEVVRENTKNINIIAKIDDLVKDEKVNVYPVVSWRPQKCKG